MKTKTRYTPVLCVFMLLLSVNYAQGQATVKANKTTKSVLEEDDEPVIFKFEPNLFSINAQRSAEIAKAKAAIDTLQISDRKRNRLLKELYKNAGTKASKKELLADIEFEDN